MPGIPYWTRPGTRERVLRSLTAAEAADAGRWHSVQGDYRTAAVWHQLAGAIEASEPDCRALTEPTRAVPLLNLAMRTEHPRTAEPMSGAAPGQDPATEVIERPVSHAPTTCAFLVTYYSSDGEQQRPCGELIRWDQGYADVTRTPGAPTEVIVGMGRWVHASDARLGPMPHPATPGQ
jgi:hypothetical protein